MKIQKTAQRLMEESLLRAREKLVEGQIMASLYRGFPVQLGPDVAEQFFCDECRIPLVDEPYGLQRHCEECRDMLCSVCTDIYKMRDCPEPR